MFKEFRVGFEQELRQARLRKRRSVALVELITTASLALSTGIAITAVSLGIARADVVSSVVEGDGALLVIALIIGLFSAMGGLTAIMTAPRRD
jgi:Na+/pantothenate symporter